VSDDSVGVYLHVPFCERVCPYCDFAVVAARRLPADREAEYVEALLAELGRRSAVFAGRRLESVYLGGGTPSLLQPGSIGRLVRAVRGAFASEGPVEVTLETNPGTVERERLPGFREAGVNRISLGVQSFQDETLKRLGRAHRASEARRALAAAREAGFDALGLDLILAAPGQSPGALERDLDEAIAFAPEHVSIYELTIEPGTPFATADARGQLDRPDEEGAVALLELAERRLAGAGYGRYELSNFARPGFEAVHNRRYWERRPVLGLGVGAVSTDPPAPGAPHGVRRQNTRDLADYVARVSRGGSAEDRAAEVFDAPTARGEAVFLALRTAAGLDAARFASEFGRAPRGYWEGPIEALVARGWLEEGPTGDLRLTPQGRLLADSVFEYFV
jgi:oxygen-independent coproporphyrinogen-3 oxidase